MSQLTKSMTSFISEVAGRFKINPETLTEMWIATLRESKKRVKKPKQEKKQELPDINKYVEMMEKSLSMPEEEYIELRNNEHDETKMWYPHIKDEEDIFTFIFGTYGIEYMRDLKSHHSKVIKDHKDAYNNWMETFFNPRFNGAAENGEEKTEEKVSNKKKTSNKKSKKSSNNDEE